MERMIGGILILVVTVVVFLLLRREIKSREP